MVALLLTSKVVIPPMGGLTTRGHWPSLGIFLVVTMWWKVGERLLASRDEHWSTSRKHRTALTTELAGLQNVHSAEYEKLGSSLRTC